MNKVLFWLMVLTVLAGCEDEQLRELSTPEVSAFIEENYLDDARELYVREILADPGHPNYSDPELDPEALTELLQAFQLVYDLGIPESDTVFNYFSIHALRCHSLHSIVMQVDPEAPEIMKLAKGIIPTGYEPLDDLLLTYEFTSVRLSYSYPRFPWLSVYSERPWNLVPLINAFEFLPAVLIAENDGGCFDGSNINLEREGDRLILHFSIGWGDCPSGCTGRRTWKFAIRNDRATFLGTSGAVYKGQP
ncbi:MAG: hypothetical protein AB2L24_14995 [Mangrovibacterium sp.]